EEWAHFRREVLVVVCYVANWPSLHRTGLAQLGHTWSLSLEEQFYLLWPLLLCGMLRLRLSRRRVFQAVAAAILASAALRCGLHLTTVEGASGAEKQAAIGRLYTGLDTRADALLVGCLVALLAAWGRLPARCHAGVGAAAVASAAGLGYLTLFSNQG